MQGVQFRYSLSLRSHFNLAMVLESVPDRNYPIAPELSRYSMALNPYVHLPHTSIHQALSERDRPHKRKNLLILTQHIRFD